MQCMRATVNSTVARFHNCVHAYQTDLTSHIHNAPVCTMHLVPISTSEMLVHKLTDCSRGTGEGQGEEEEDTKEGQEVVTASGRPSRANWHL